LAGVSKKTELDLGVDKGDFLLLSWSIGVWIFE
jgi:hypothetical protein